MFSALPPARLHRRVVVTGLGLVCPLGVGAGASWSALLANSCGVRPGGTDLLDVPVARVPRGPSPHEWDVTRVVPRSDSRTMSPEFIAFVLAAAGEALADAALLPASHCARGGALADVPSASLLGDGGTRVGPYASTRVGVAVGSGIGAVEEVGAAARSLARGEKISPFFVPRILLNMAAGSVSMRFGLRGPNIAGASACASGAHAIGDAFRLVQSGAADVMVAGGTEAAIGPIAVAGFSRARALATAECRPFDAARDGFVLGEGAGVLVLEAEENARARGARIYGEIRGVGMSGDAYHVTTPREDGTGAAQCMSAALADGGLEPSDVGYVNAHATGTPAGDRAEALGIASIWRAAGSSVAVSSTKGHIGHLLGAAGAAEAVISLLALAHSTLPGTLNLGVLDADIEKQCAAGGPLRVLRKTERVSNLRAVLSNSFGFGGTNVSLLFSSAELDSGVRQM